MIFLLFGSSSVPLADEIRMLTEAERQELVAEVLPLLLLTLGSIQAVTRVLPVFSY